MCPILPVSCRLAPWSELFRRGSIRGLRTRRTPLHRHRTGLSQFQTTRSTIFLSVNARRSGHQKANKGETHTPPCPSTSACQPGANSGPDAEINNGCRVSQTRETLDQQLCRHGHTSVSRLGSGFSDAIADSAGFGFCSLARAAFGHDSFYG